MAVEEDLTNIDWYYALCRENRQVLSTNTLFLEEADLEFRYVNRKRRKAQPVTRSYPRPRQAPPKRPYPLRKALKPRSVLRQQSSGISLLLSLAVLLGSAGISSTITGFFIRKSILANPPFPESVVLTSSSAQPQPTPIVSPSATPSGNSQVGLLPQQPYQPPYQQPHQQQPYQPHQPPPHPQQLAQANAAAEQKRLTYSVPKQHQGAIVESAELKIARDAIALTFDDGPWDVTTDQILDILAQEGVKATFFWVGQAVQNRPEIARRVVHAGHAIGNHTWHHRYEPMSEVEAASEIEIAAQIFRETTGIQTMLFRPPGGYLNNGLADYAISQGHTVVMWSVSSADTDPGNSAQDYIENVLADVQPGGIVLLHDGGGDRSKTVAALPTIIRSLKAQGYRFVTVPELLQLESDGW
nr:MAG: polysaccharide deacetylase family protein [Leptolyngbya sp. IPPAS B-1204]